jgi:uncharacterized delta-60 repeat protein
MFRQLMILAIVIIHVVHIYAEEGFGSSGIVTTDFASDTDIAYSIAIQSDGKVLVSGSASSSGTTSFALVRYNSDGSLDTDFSSDGKATAAVGGGYSVATQSDGKIVAGGQKHNGSNHDFAVVRYNADGSLDTDFGSDGLVITDIGSNDDLGRSVAIQSDGKILLAGSSYNGSNWDFAVVRYNADGSLDTDFDSDGMVTTAVGSSTDIGRTMVIQSDGKIIVGGDSNNGSNNDFALARYNSDGTLDTDFSSDGKLTTAIGSGSEYGFSVAIQTDSKLLLAGYSDNGSNNDFALVRYNSDGTLDTGFSSDGKVTTSIGSNDDEGQSVVVQSDGKIVVAGDAYNGSNNDFALVRYNSDGTLDTGFSSDGKVTTSIGSGEDNLHAIAILSSGNLVVAGGSHNGSNYDFALARYFQSDGSLPVELSYFNLSNLRSSEVTLNWATESELENLGFIIERCKADGKVNNWFEIASYITDIALVGQGSTAERTEYSYTDCSIEPGESYEYRLADVSYQGVLEYHTLRLLTTAPNTATPSRYSLHKNYPNPFNPSTTIAYDIPKQSRVQLTIHDVEGRLVKTIQSRIKEPGRYEDKWSGQDQAGNMVSTGLYFCRLQVDGYNETMKMLYLK